MSSSYFCSRGPCTEGWFSEHVNTPHQPHSPSGRCASAAAGAATAQSHGLSSRMGITPAATNGKGSHGAAENRAHSRDKSVRRDSCLGRAAARRMKHAARATGRPRGERFSADSRGEKPGDRSGFNIRVVRRNPGPNVRTEDHCRLLSLPCPSPPCPPCLLPVTLPETNL